MAGDPQRYPPTGYLHASLGNAHTLCTQLNRRLIVGFTPSDQAFTHPLSNNVRIGSGSVNVTVAPGSGSALFKRGGPLHPHQYFPNEIFAIHARQQPADPDGCMHIRLIVSKRYYGRYPHSSSFAQRDHVAS